MKPRNKMSLPLVLGIGGLGLLIAVQVAIATHPGPKGARPVRISLVPAYEKYTSSNTTHGPPLAFPSCSPPVQASDFLTVGTPDANGAPAQSVGSVRINVLVGNPGPPDDSEVRVEGNITDVRCKSGVSTCGNGNAQGGPDYTGELDGNATVRITDHFNGPNRDQAATVVDIGQPITLQCQSTADTSIGGVCKFPVVECLGCPPPKEGVRTVAEITDIKIRDGGPDGAAYTQDNTLFMIPGIFIP
jgi:hypothetical protein